MLDLKDLYWLAGLLEGEGCFSKHTYNRSKNINLNWKPKLEVGSTDKDIIIRASLLLTKRDAIWVRASKNKPFYYVAIRSKHAIGWMMTLYPLMGIRRKAKIKSIIEDWKLYSSREEKAYVA